MSRYHVSDTAWADLDELLEFIAERNLPAAERLADDLFEAFADLGEHPHLGRPRDDLQAGLRCYVLGTYLIFYRPLTSGVEIFRVLHGARDLGALFEP